MSNVSMKIVFMWLTFLNVLYTVSGNGFSASGIPCIKRNGLCGCVFTDKFNGNKLMQISLSALNKYNQPYFNGSLGADSFIYYINLCTGFNYPLKNYGQKINCTDVTGCRVSQDCKDVSTIAKPGIRTFSNYDPHTRLTVMYGLTGDGRQMILHLKCTKGVEGRVTKIIDSSTKGYYIDIESKHVCPTPYSNPNVQTSDESVELSIGSMVLITFFAILLIYFIFGMSINACCRGATGKDIIPNASFWFSLPGLTKDGCLFCGAKLKQLC